MLLAVQVVRNAAVLALVTLHPQAAERVWSDHPSVEIASALSEIGRASRERRSIDRRTFAMIDDAAAKSPLSPEPFLVRGVQAQLAGDSETAKRSYIEAQLRDPRSLPAAYFLANFYFGAGDALSGLKQTALLARLSPGGTAAIAPFVAAYAQNPANWPQIRGLFRSQSAVEDGVLMAMAHDARNAKAILAVADAGHRRPSSPWLPILLNSMVQAGDFAWARAIWSSIGRANVGSDLIYDADFASATASPPFNWNLAASTVGLAERERGRGLHVIFYGNEDGVLASELLLLAPGTYSLRAPLVGSQAHPEVLLWSIRCAGANAQISSASANQAAAGRWMFDVPANCPAQWLELAGRSGDISQQGDVTIGPLSLVRAASHG